MPKKEILKDEGTILPKKINITRCGHCTPTSNRGMPLNEDQLSKRGSNIISKE